MIVRLNLFAAAKDIMGAEVIEFPLADGSTVGELKQAIIEQFPTMMEIVEKSSIAVDKKYAPDECPLYHGAEIGLIPPVSGG